MSGEKSRADEAPSDSPEMGRAAVAMESLSAEMGLLSAVWLDGMDGAPTLRRAVAAGLTWRAFSAERLGMLWHATVKCFEERGAVDMALVADWLRSKGKLEVAGGLPELMAVGDQVPTTTHAAAYLERVLDCWYRRRALCGLLRATEAVKTLPAWSEVQGALGKELGEVRQLQLLQRGMTVSDAADHAAAWVKLRAEGREDMSRWVPTGFPTFDRRFGMMGSLSPEDHFVIWMGASGYGKSASMRQVAWHALQAGRSVVSFSRETGTVGFVTKMAGMAARVNLLQLARTEAKEMAVFDETVKTIREVYAGRRLWSYEHCRDNPLHTVEDLEDALRRHADVHGAPDLVLVDYLQQLGTRKRTQSREAAVAEVSHQLQGLSREFRTVVLAGVQVNRSGISEQNQVKRDKDGKVLHRLPGMQDLRESDAPYHDADRVVALYRPPEDCRGQDQTTGNVMCPEMWICQIKCRDGVTGYVRTWFRKTLLRFEEIEGARRD